MMSILPSTTWEIFLKSPGTWYGGVHIEGKSGVPVSLDKDEYMELDTEPQEQKNPA